MSLSGSENSVSECFGVCSPESRELPSLRSYIGVLVKCQKQMRKKIDLGKKPEDDITGDSNLQSKLEVVKKRTALEKKCKWL